MPHALGVGAGTVDVEGVDAGEGAVARTTVTGLQAVHQLSQRAQVIAPEGRLLAAVRAIRERSGMSGASPYRSWPAIAS